MNYLIYKVESVLVLAAFTVCFLNTFLEGWMLIKTAGELNIIMGITEIILSIALVFLYIVFYQFYKLVVQWQNTFSEDKEIT